MIKHVDPAAVASSGQLGVVLGGQHILLYIFYSDFYIQKRPRYLMLTKMFILTLVFSDSSTHLVI